MLKKSLHRGRVIGGLGVHELRNCQHERGQNAQTLATIGAEDVRQPRKHSFQFFMQDKYSTCNQERPRD